MDMHEVVQQFGHQLETLGGDLDLRHLAGMVHPSLMQSFDGLIRPSKILPRYPN